MHISIVNHQSDYDPKRLQSEHLQAMNTAMYTVTRHHVQNILSRHFKGNARWVYQHGPRKAKYLKKKYAIITRAVRDNEGRTPNRGEIVDLVYTGKFRNEALSRSRASYGPFTGVVTVAGRVLNLPPAPGSQVDMKREITTMSKRELVEIGALYTESFKNSLAKLSPATAIGIYPGDVRPGTTHVI